MREIKFRYTIKRENGYIFHQVFCIDEIENDQVSPWIKFNTINKDTIFRRQYTGLLDKNGKEIYEGDIVETHTRNSGGFDNVWIKVYAEITFEYARWFVRIFKKEPDRGASQIDLCFQNNQLEVIGNIHENGDLFNND